MEVQQCSPHFLKTTRRAYPLGSLGCSSLRSLGRLARLEACPRARGPTLASPYIYMYVYMSRDLYVQCDPAPWSAQLKVSQASANQTVSYSRQHQLNSSLSIAQHEDKLSWSGTACGRCDLHLYLLSFASCPMRPQTDQSISHRRQQSLSSMKTSAPGLERHAAVRSSSCRVQLIDSKSSLALPPVSHASADLVISHADELSWRGTAWRRRCAAWTQVLNGRRQRSSIRTIASSSVWNLLGLCSLRAVKSRGSATIV